MSNAILYFLTLPILPFFSSFYTTSLSYLPLTSLYHISYPDHSHFSYLPSPLILHLDRIHPLPRFFYNILLIVLLLSFLLICISHLNPSKYIILLFLSLHPGNVCPSPSSCYYLSTPDRFLSCASFFLSLYFFLSSIRNIKQTLRVADSYFRSFIRVLLICSRFS